VVFIPKRLIEAALFMSSKPLTIEDLSKITGIASLGKIEERLEELRKEYEGRGFEIVRSPEGWSMEVRSEMLPKVAHLTRYSDLSGGQRRTLALIAYKEPVRQSEIVRIQGNKAYSYIKRLVKKGLVKSEKEGRTRILMLTREFERYFGEDKQRIKEMLEQEAVRIERKGEEEKTSETPD
jgi:segregation and condensation protein B